MLDGRPGSGWGLESIQDLNFRLVIQTKIQFWRMIKIQLYFFPTSYWNYEQSQQKLGTFLEKSIYFKNLSYQNKWFIWVDLLFIRIFLKRLKKIEQFSTQKNYFENQNFQTFDIVVDNFDKFNDGIILWKYYFFLFLEA